MPGSSTTARVLMTADTVGGVWDYSLQLAEALSHRGVAVTLASMGPRPSRDQQAAVRHVPGLELVSMASRLEWMEDPWSDVARAGEWLLDLESRIDPDIVHLNGFAHGSLSWRAPVLVVGHSCVCSWWQAVRRELLPPEWRTYRERVRTGLLAADAAAAPTHTMARALAEHYGRPDAVVVPNGRDARYFSPGPKAPFILCAGRLWDEAKNVRLLTAAAPHLPWVVYVAGDAAGPDGSAPRLDNVRLLGRLPSTLLRHWMACASVYVLPAKYEPFGLSALEAALCRCALVLGDIPSLRENWDGCAVFVPVDDPEALTASIRRLIDEPRQLQRFAERARARALELSAERMAEGYLHVYDSLCGGVSTAVRRRAWRGPSCAS
jgi:glycosyltransferase involved in cell wall biosynthesis